ncbi:hypothetical protein CDL12_20862 [Handroanthus impetiginosus]|uniref:Uncharacterized protein n=1 Tax=Handroanthus impetiginosus TaxID=429701 RepID=A0A2G9GMQ2_9LAMI|nr:hypothetical protein CDL12_20862 [Handroanthus impetiginosus]
MACKATLALNKAFNYYAVSSTPFRSGLQHLSSSFLDKIFLFFCLSSWHATLFHSYCCPLKDASLDQSNKSTSIACIFENIYRRNVNLATPVTAYGAYFLWITLSCFLYHFLTSILLLSFVLILEKIALFEIPENFLLDFTQSNDKTC